MRLDLTELKRMHPLLPASTALEYAHRAAMGLERHGHRPGQALGGSVLEQALAARLEWLPADLGAAKQLDRDRVTEDAAEGVSLALVSAACGWTVRRRLQRGEHADWLLAGSASERIAIEISGVDRGDERLRVAEKRVQVGRCLGVDQRVACVVQLETPRATVVRS